ncbi:MAG: hypothetical protein K2H28_03540 [Ruminococcus sp.]|nr:hypothetical protein [Ruminococcus sp.]
MGRFSYKNIYDTKKYNEFIESKRYVIDDKFLSETENYELPDDFSLEISTYEEERQSKSHKVFISAQKVTLKNADSTIYEYYCYYDHTRPFTEIIHHKNGHRYYPFHIDLYGISFLDVDTLEVYNYIPEGYEHDDKYRCGESFIVTDIHYDKESNLIAYGGCYWACPCEVMVGDFSEPMNFNPHLISLHDVLDPEYNYDDIDFKEWKNKMLYVLCDEEEKSLSVEELKEKINELTTKGK